MAFEGLQPVLTSAIPSAIMNSRCHKSTVEAHMSEALDKVRGVRELPLFPLPVVLFPGMPMPLPVFSRAIARCLRTFAPAATFSAFRISTPRRRRPGHSEGRPHRLRGRSD